MAPHNILIPILLGYLSVTFAWSPSLSTSRCSNSVSHLFSYQGPSHNLKTPFSRTMACQIQANPLEESSTLVDLVQERESPPILMDQRQASFLSWNDVEWNDELLKKFFNAMLLIVSFGFALYTIFSVDNGMTRGWTQSEIAMRIPVDNWSSYESALAESPIVTKTTINVIIYLLGDWLSQTVFAKKNVLDFDAKRTLRNGFIGLCFGPLVHMYYEWSDTILPVEAGLLNRVKKIFMDQTLYLSIKCSIYISAVGLLAGEDWEDVKQTVKERIGPVCFTAWKFWPLVHCITYGVVPARHRILWVNCVDLVWNAILSTLSRKAEPEVVDASVTVATLYKGPDEGFQTIPAPAMEPDTTINKILLDGAGVKEQDDVDKEPQNSMPLYEPPAKREDCTRTD
jgi:protein Mpv17